MPLRPSIDDNNTTLIDYQGEWELLIGSTRQWEATVHATRQVGATATFKFRGYQIWIWGTIPAGVGTNLIDISIDGSTPNVTSRTSNGSAVYNELYYESALLRDTYHTVVVTNRGSDATGNTEFLLDRFEFETSENVPIFTATGMSTTPTPTPTPTETSLVGSGAGSSGGSKTPVGAIAGAVIGVFVLIFGVILYLLWRRRKRSRGGSVEEKASAASPNVALTPFPVNEMAATSSQSSTTLLSPSDSVPHQSSSQVSEKAGYRNRHLASVSLPTGSTHQGPVPAGLTSPTTLETAASSQRVLPFSPSLTDANSAYASNEAASSLYVPHTSQPLVPIRRSATSEFASSDLDPYDNPPPSYWQEVPSSGPGRA